MTQLDEAEIDEVIEQNNRNIQILEDELKIIDKNDLSMFAKPLQNNEFKCFLTTHYYKSLYALLNKNTLEYCFSNNYTSTMAIVCNPFLDDCEKKLLLQRMLELGFNINDRNIYGETVLYLAVERGLDDVAIFLLKSGANPNIATQLGITPLMITSYNDKIYLSSILTYYGADWDIKSKIKNIGIKEILENNLCFGVENLLNEIKP